ncbi:MAG: response regulator [Pseudomonas sp.]
MDNGHVCKLLLVEDDRRLSRLIREFLEQNGFEVMPVYRGDEALSLVTGFIPQVVILDLMLPGLSGLHLCREIRRQTDVPVLMLTAREDSLDQILGLESGADDYVVKPVEPLVLLARLRALLRRQQPSGGQGDCLTFGALSIDRSQREVRLGGCTVELSTMEFELLWLLASAAGRVLSRDEILNCIRGIDFDGQNRAVDVCVSKLRGKLADNPREPIRIKTVWGRGYLFNPAGWSL